jgi:hypothetical protein
MATGTSFYFDLFLARRIEEGYSGAGFIVEGTLRECLRLKDGYESLIIMSMLQQEYEKRKFS